ncbi:MAG: porin family protein [Hyphomonadaceae bacterium]
MKIKLAIAAAAGLLTAPCLMAAQAQTTAYVNGGYTQFDTHNSDSPDLGGFTARIGADFGPNWGIEGEGSAGAHDDHGVKLKNELGIFGVAKLPVSESFDVFARVGMARIKTSPDSPDSNGAAYGIGAEYFLTPKDGIRGDFTRYDGDRANAFSISYTRKF